jgi:hypothetical protein
MSCLLLGRHGFDGEEGNGGHEESVRSEGFTKLGPDRCTLIVTVMSRWEVVWLLFLGIFWYVWALLVETDFLVRSEMLWMAIWLIAGSRSLTCVLFSSFMVMILLPACIVVDLMLWSFLVSNYYHDGERDGRAFLGITNECPKSYLHIHWAREAFFGFSFI